VAQMGLNRMGKAVVVDRYGARDRGLESGATPGQPGRYARRIGCVVFVIALKRNIVTMYLLTPVPLRWGDRDRARRFQTKGEARHCAAGLKITGAWTIEPV
jgi:hypothetical protein